MENLRIRRATEAMVRSYDCQIGSLLVYASVSDFKNTRFLWKW